MIDASMTLSWYFEDEITRLGQLDIAIDPDSDAHAWSATMRLSERHALAVYDAAYLELAQRRRIELATTGCRIGGVGPGDRDGADAVST